MKTVLSRLWKEEQGQDLVEYVLLLTLMSLVSLASLHTLSSAVDKIYSGAAKYLTVSIGA